MDVFTERERADRRVIVQSCRPQRRRREQAVVETFRSDDPRPHMSCSPRPLRATRHHSDDAAHNEENQTRGVVLSLSLFSLAGWLRRSSGNSGPGHCSSCSGRHLSSIGGLETATDCAHSTPMWRSIRTDSLRRRRSTAPGDTQCTLPTGNIVIDVWCSLIFLFLTGGYRGNCHGRCSFPLAC